MANGVVSNLPVPLPPILAGHLRTPETSRKRVEHFYFSVAAIFETWVKRRQSRHTRRAYREDVMAFVRHVGIEWPQDCAVVADGFHHRRTGIPRKHDSQ